MTPILLQQSDFHFTVLGLVRAHVIVCGSVKAPLMNSGTTLQNKFVSTTTKMNSSNFVRLHHAQEGVGLGVELQGLGFSCSVRG